MLIHELAHLAAALYIGLRPSHIIIEPFGVNLRLKNKIVYSLTDEIILYMSGPCVNFIFAVISAVAAHSDFTYLHDFALKNTALFIINILPIVPLDGGIVLKKILMCKIGNRNAEKITKAISISLIGVLITFGFILTIKSQFNFSVLFLCVFLFMNVFTQKEKYNVDFVKELMFYKRKTENFHEKKLKIILVSENDKLKKITECFTYSTFTIVFVLDKGYTVSNIFTESEIIEEILSKGSETTFAVMTHKINKYT